MKKRDYREKTINGVMFNGKFPLPRPCKVTVRMTSDHLGQSLSLNVDNILIEIPLEAVKDIITITEKR